MIDNKKARFFLLLALTPIFWMTVLSTGSVLKNLPRYPNQTKNKVLGVYSEQRIAYVEEFRHQSTIKTNNTLLPRVFYNKAWIVADEAAGYFTFLSPRLYFQAGDGTQFSPPNIEPIPIVYFPLFTIGLFSAIKNRKNKIILLWLASALPAYLAGQKNFSLLFLAVIPLIYFVNESFNFLSQKNKKLLLIPLSMYSLFLFGRALMLHS